MSAQVALPLALGGAAAGARCARPPASGRRALLVEDDPLTRKVVSRLLRRCAFDVHEVVDGRQVRERRVGIRHGREEGGARASSFQVRIADVDSAAQRSRGAPRRPPGTPCGASAVPCRSAGTSPHPGRPAWACAAAPRRAGGHLAVTRVWQNLGAYIPPAPHL